MKEALLKPDLSTVKAVVETHCKLINLPVTITLGEMGLSTSHLHELSLRIRKVFAVDIRLEITDTIQTITQRILR